jgi:hypothetical protein
VEVAVSAALIFGLSPVVCSAASPAQVASPVQSAQEEAAATPANEANVLPIVRRWYGWQTFAVDGVAAGLFVGAVADQHNTALFGVSAITFGFGAPAIHVAHGHWDLALGSLGLRIIGPLLGAALGSQFDVHTSNDGPGAADSSSKWTAAGVAIGGLVASVTDGLALAYDAQIPTSVRPRNQLLRAEPFPQLMVLRHGAGLGYSGRF